MYCFRAFAMAERGNRLSSRHMKKTGIFLRKLWHIAGRAESCRVHLWCRGDLREWRVTDFSGSLGLALRHYPLPTYTSNLESENGKCWKEWPIGTPKEAYTRHKSMPKATDIWDPKGPCRLETGAVLAKTKESIDGLLLL